MEGLLACLAAASTPGHRGRGPPLRTARRMPGAGTRVPDAGSFHRQDLHPVFPSGVVFSPFFEDETSIFMSSLSAKHVIVISDILTERLPFSSTMHERTRRWSKRTFLKRSCISRILVCETDSLVMPQKRRSVLARNITSCLSYGGTKVISPPVQGFVPNPFCSRNSFLVLKGWLHRPVLGSEREMNWKTSLFASTAVSMATWESD